MLAQKITEITKSFKKCYIFNTNCIYFKIVRRRTEMAHQQQPSSSGSRIIECAVGESLQSPPLAFVLEEDIVSRCSNQNDVI